MELHNVQSKEALRIGKPERLYISSLRSCPMEPRRRPLRTYSKRTSSTESIEPTPKRRCINNLPMPSIQDEDTKPSTSDSEHGATASMAKLPPSLPLTKKGTITAYFGRITPQLPAIISSSDPISEPLSEDGPIITPPSSPPAIPTKRRTRRLKTRVVTQHLDEKEASDEEQENQDEKERIGRTRVRESPALRCASALSEITPNTLNQTENTATNRSEDGKVLGNKRQEKKTASVQTTLSLSINEAQYTECKECGMLYNHLHKMDVQYHARRHAALRRAKIRASAENDVAE
ncbi:hypothetical protein GGS24DRAFT_14107 [Hypoxylon argillaceum]|nr:hypothetical protein GGS24DRAFT_14107 [Hypoxylon argillaceum]